MQTTQQTRPDHVQALNPQHAWRLMNTGATVIVSAVFAGQRNAMAAAWNMALDFAPGAAKAAVVIDKSCFTRKLIESSNRFAVGVCCAEGMAACVALGTHSANDAPAHDKLGQLQVPWFEGSAHADGALPLTLGCVGWLELERYAEPHLEQSYDLFIGRITAAWADSRAVANDKFRPLADIAPALRTIHHLGAGQFVVPGEQVSGG
jgi:flavin reductase (DIM6/NTAB) family NADH-FMN oxidoreductase RutF